MEELSTSFEVWATECAERGLKGPHRFADGRGFQFLDDSGTAAVWNTACNPPRGFIFSAAPAMAKGQP